MTSRRAAGTAALARLTLAGLTLAGLSLAAAPAQAALSPDYLAIGDLKGTWVGTVQGRVAGQWTTTQARIVWTERKGSSAVGNLSLRSCEGRAAACSSRSAKGGGWSDPEDIQVALMTDGTLSGRSETMSVLGFAQGDASLELTLTPYYVVDRTATVHYGRLVPAG